MKNILPETLKQDLRRLKLNDMAQALDEALQRAAVEREGHLTFLAGLVNKQLDALDARSLERRIKKAGFPERLTFETFDWSFQPGLNVEYVKDLAQLGFVDKRQPLLILGKTGTGKTHLATALGINACRARYRVAFFLVQDLLFGLHKALLNNTTSEIIARLARNHMLILDGLGYVRSKPEYPSLLFDLVNACRGRVSLVITSNISFEEWGQNMGNPSIINAIIDRLLDRACLINIRPGRSYRTDGPHVPRPTPDSPHH
jgi:DNA replication protein DnaC